MNKTNITKGMRIQMCALAGLYKSSSNDGCVALSDILPKDVRPSEVESIVIDWLDENCSNGYTSRWTNFGNNLMIDANRFTENLISVYQRFGF